MMILSQDGYGNDETLNGQLRQVAQHGYASSASYIERVW